MGSIGKLWLGFEIFWIENGLDWVDIWLGWTFVWAGMVILLCWTFGGLGFAGDFDLSGVGDLTGCEIGWVRYLVGFSFD